MGDKHTLIVKVVNCEDSIPINLFYVLVGRTNILD